MDAPKHDSVRYQKITRRILKPRGIVNESIVSIVYTYYIYGLVFVLFLLAIDRRSIFDGSHPGR